MNLSGFDSFYFSLVTVTTLGYGDIHPAAESIWTKVMVSMELLIGVTFIILIIGAIVSIITELYGGRKLGDK